MFLPGSYMGTMSTRELIATLAAITKSTATVNAGEIRFTVTDLGTLGGLGAAGRAESKRPHGPWSSSCLWCADDRQNCGLYVGFSPCESDFTWHTESVTMVGGYRVLFFCGRVCRVVSEISS